jgi:hypothetical protein
VSGFKEDGDFGVRTALDQVKSKKRHGYAAQVFATEAPMRRRGYAGLWEERRRAFAVRSVASRSRGINGLTARVFGLDEEGRLGNDTAC